MWLATKCSRACGFELESPMVLEVSSVRALELEGSSSRAQAPGGTYFRVFRHQFPGFLYIFLRFSALSYRSIHISKYFCDTIMKLYIFLSVSALSRRTLYISERFRRYRADTYIFLSVSALSRRKSTYFWAFRRHRQEKATYF